MLARAKQALDFPNVGPFQFQRDLTERSFYYQNVADMHHTKQIPGLFIELLGLLKRSQRPESYEALKMDNDDSPIINPLGS